MCVCAGLECFLQLGRANGQSDGSGSNRYFDAVQACGGVRAIRQLRHRRDAQVRERASSMLDTYFAQLDE